jgi:PAS domain S-box-containing protein
VTDNKISLEHPSAQNRREPQIPIRWKDPVGLLIYAAVITLSNFSLYASSLYSYLLFHSLIEFTTIAIAFTLFILTWNTSRFLTSGHLITLGIGYGLIALIDLFHALAYKGMGIFPGDDANLPTQLWIAARGLQALLLCLAPLFARRTINMKVFSLIAFACVCTTMALVFSGLFPDCFIEGVGLTRFKINSEYLISLFLLGSLGLFIRQRSSFNTRVFRLIICSILCTIGSELAFTSYLSVYGPANMTGHFLKLAAFYLIYRALVVTGFQEPFELIFRNIKQTEQDLTREREFSRSLLDSMADGVVACDADGLLTLFNQTARQWHGLAPQPLSPERWTQSYNLFRADGTTPLPTNEIPLARAYRGESVVAAVMTIKAKGQPLRFILANGSVIRDQEEKKLGAVVVMRDITELRRMDQELRRTNEILEERVTQRTAELAQANAQLNRELSERRKIEATLRKLTEELEQRVKDRTIELERRNLELEQMNKAFVGRELRMAELKKQIKTLEDHSQERGGQDVH